MRVIVIDITAVPQQLHLGHISVQWRSKRTGVKRRVIRSLCQP
jgi:hypothetical protein